MPRIMHRNYPPTTVSAEQLPEMLKLGWYTSATGPLPIPVAKVEEVATMPIREPKKGRGRPRKGL